MFLSFAEANTPRGPFYEPTEDIEIQSYNISSITVEKTEISKTLAEKIVMCESEDDHYNSDGTVKCNGKYGCDSGIGLWQIIPSTAQYCSRKIGKSIDPFDENDNQECGEWLLENEGSHHWGYPPDDPRGYVNGKRWGSYDCWSLI